MVAFVRLCVIVVYLVCLRMISVCVYSVFVLYRISCILIACVCRVCFGFVCDECMCVFFCICL